jgi:tetratricopeptide (TPR) repeat protein
MASRRLNKKVAWIGTVVFVSLVVMAALVVLTTAQDLDQLIADGDAALAAQDYESARRNYAEAFESTQSFDQKVELLFKMSDVYRATGDWRRALGCWEQVITSDPKNLPARLGRLKYAYILADSLSDFGQNIDSYWKDVSAQATELIDLVEDQGWLEKEKAAWEPSFGAGEHPGWDSGIRLLGPYLYFLKGRAAFELASMGAVADPAQALEEAQSDLVRSKQLDPANAAAYRYLAAAFLEAGGTALSRGNLNEREAALKAAEAVLAEGVAVAGDGPSAHVNALVRRLTLAQSGTMADTRNKMKALEPEYQALTERFPTSPEAFAAQAEFYSCYSACVNLDDGREMLDRAIEAAEKAVALDPATVKYARFAATLYYRKSSLHEDQAALLKTIEMAEAALSQPQAQDAPGPRHYAVLAERLSLRSLLVTSCVERLLALPPVAPERSELLAKAEDAVQEIRQIQGSADNPHVVKWQGMLELVRGRTDNAVRSLYRAYEQIEAASPSDEVDALLSYTLGKLFEGTPEVGAAIEFFESALHSGMATARPKAILDYGRVLLRAGLYDAALNAVNSYDERFGVNPQSRQFRVRTLIANGHLTEAEEVLASLTPTDPNTLRLRLSLLGAEAVQMQEAIQRAESSSRSGDEGHTAQTVDAMKAELLGYRKRQAHIAGQLWRQEADISEQEHLTLLCETLIAGHENSLARSLVEVFLDRLPNSETALFYQGLLSESDPGGCSPARRREIHMEAIGRIVDPVTQAMARAAFCQENDRLDEAITQWRQVLNATDSSRARNDADSMNNEQSGPRHVAVGRLFDVACYREDWRLAEEMVKVAKTDNLDGCQGRLYAGRLAFARGRPQEALTELDECLRLRPVFSYGHMLRGNIHAAAGNDLAAVEDHRKAADFNPVDPVVAKALASALLVRNRNLGSRVSEEQHKEARRALEYAIRLNPGDTQIFIAYADLLDSSEPLKALAIRQAIQANTPSLANAVLLGRLATRLALKETDDAKRETFFATAQTAFEQARQTDPSNALLLENYAEYYRARGQNDKAQQLLVESQDGRLLWRHYYRIGRYEEARRLLEQMLNDQANQADAMKGLIWVAEATGDREAIKKYAEQLLSIEDNVTNRLAQIRAYLDVGLVQQAKHRLQSLKERHPDEPRIGLLEALLAKRQGQLKRALELANRNLEKNQQDPSAWRLRGEIHLLIGTVDQAITDFRKSRSLEDNAATTVGLAKAYLWAGRDSEAVSELQAALAAPTSLPEARALLESIYQRSGQDDLLGQLYADTLNRWPNSTAWLARAGAFALGQRDYARTCDLYEKAYRLRRDQLSDTPAATRDAPLAILLDGYLHALVLSAASGEPDATWRSERLEKIFSEGGRHIDTPYAAVALGRMAEAKKVQGDMAAARDYGHKAIDEAWDDDALAFQTLSRVVSVLGPDEVSTYCRQRLEAAPDSPGANLMMSHLARVQGDYDDAVGYVDKCIALSDPQSQERVGYEQRKADLLTAAYRETSDKEYLRRVIDVCESLVAQMPTNSNVLNNLAYMLAQDDRELDRALDYAGKVLAADPDNAVYLDTYAYVLHKSGRNAEAAESIAAAIQQHEVAGAPSAAVYEHLGMIAEALGEKENALAAYRHALHVADENVSDAAKQRIRLAVERLQ